MCSLELYIQMLCTAINNYGLCCITLPFTCIAATEGVFTCCICFPAELNMHLDRGLTSVGLHVLQQVVVELELDATGTTSVGF